MLADLRRWGLDTVRRQGAFPYSTNEPAVGGRVRRGSDSRTSCRSCSMVAVPGGRVRRCSPSSSATPYSVVDYGAVLGGRVASVSERIETSPNDLLKCSILLWT